MPADLITGLPEKILSQCGLVSMLLMIAVIWLAIQLAKTRAAWEEVMRIVAAQSQAQDNLERSYAKLKEIVSSAGR